MTYDELRIFILEEIDWYGDQPYVASVIKYLKSTLAVVELHKPEEFENGPDDYKLVCSHCQLGVIGEVYPCETIQAIEKELA